MRRRRFLWPIFVLVLAGVVYVFDERREPARTPLPRPPAVDLNVPGMQMRAAPPDKPATPPAPVSSPGVPAPPGAPSIPSAPAAPAPKVPPVAPVAPGPATPGPAEPTVPPAR